VRTAIAGAAVLLSASLLLAGCASHPAGYDYNPPIAKTTVAVGSIPGFLATPQTAADNLGSSLKNIEASSIRYQGTVHGTKVFLGVQGGANGGNTVVLIFGMKKGFGYGNSIGNTVLTSLLPHNDWVEYIPQGASANTLKGFEPLSKWIIVHKEK
jgi:hypothetical protein